MRTGLSFGLEIMARNMEKIMRKIDDATKNEIAGNGVLQ